MDDGNALMLPGRKKKSNEKKKVQVKPKPNLSKSQMRKLKKIEDDKEKEILLSQSIEELEKYKIKDDMYSLMWSSSNLGQVETARGKRLREVQFSKAGLEGPYGDRPPKKKYSTVSNETGCETSMIRSTQAVKNDDFTSTPIMEVEVQGVTSSSLKFSEKQSNGNGPRGCTDSGGALSKSNDLPIQEGTNSSYSKTNSNLEELMKDIIDEPAKFDVSSRSTLANCGAPTTPTVVRVSRPSEVEDKRKDLPIVMMEQEIMEAINENPSVIICGETGCGKTTQVPQFLYEAGFGSNLCTARGGIVGVTQPRRVAVLATAKRVAFELGLRLGKEVGFQVRHDRRVGSSCSIKFMTDGILLRELQNDFLLRRYSVIILDEAHERSLNTDILIGMLSRIILERQRQYEQQQQNFLSGIAVSPEDRVYPLKLILMSATLRVEDFVSGKRIFPDPPPVIEVPTRQYPVTIHFSKRTEIVDYVGQAYKKVLSIHKKLPPGGILVFLTGQREVEFLCRKLRKASNERSKTGALERSEVYSEPKDHATEDNDMKDISEAFEIQGKSDDQITDRFSSYDEDQGDLSDEESDLSYDSEGDSDLDYYDGASGDHKSLEFDQNHTDLSGVNSNLASLKAAFQSLDRKKCSNVDYAEQDGPPHALEGKLNDRKSFPEEASVGKNNPPGPLFVLPLYAMLPASAQLRVFDQVKEGARLVVVATNVAETSLTIPGIKYVVDTGREKVKKYNPLNGIETYEIQWISKASASQRSGRAGRTGPGHCYRLYSSAVFSNILSDFSLAEISKVPVDGVVLLMKSMHIDKVSNFPFPTPPDASALVEAEICLKTLSALDDKGKLTPMGKAMAQYPMSPRHSRMLLTVIEMMQNIKNYARANLVLAYAVAAAAALSLSNPFIVHLGSGSNDAEESKDEEKSGIQEKEKRLSKEERSQKKKLKEIAKASRTKFSNPTSDALSIAYALQCFELSGNPVEFCSSNTLHLKTMEEMSKLRKQLLQLVFSSKLSGFCWVHGSVDDVECAWKISSDKHPLKLCDEDILGQAICAGWADRIARRIKGVAGLSEEDRKVYAVRYQACMVKETVFLHRWSSLAKSAPEFLVYSELLKTRRPYIHGATSVKAKWLCEYARSSCTFSAPLTDPKPYYDPSTDQVFCWVAPTFGPHLWKLPLHSLPIENEMTRVATFACALLEGQVLPCLKSVRELLSSSPSIIMRPESLGLKKVGNLLYRLRRPLKIVDSCATLRSLWDENPNELFSEILEWYQKGFHGQFEKLWIEMQRESRLDPAERFPKRVKKREGIHKLSHQKPR
ncbi:RNA helicase [Lithospermum erythrorhizon]|uniref:RNA helicase n=1 Tax=Lithospermum erythrorhizon TaxID=34254 RepID=A0AAV3NGN6_LITER